jgi:adenylylsulfate kinase
MTKPVFAIWFTGLPASGKSTLANLLAQEMQQRRRQVQVLDSDQLREMLTPQPTYGAEERTWFYQTLAYIASLLANNRVNTIVAATAHRRAYRLRARDYLPDLIEIYVKCSLETCMARDQKGIYTKAMSKEAIHVPGVQELYEIPESPAIVVNTEQHSPQECLLKILARLADFGYLEKEI